MKHPSCNLKQQGAVLAVSLIFLLVLTLLGIAGMQSTIMEEKMSGNMRDKALAFQASESGLINGETHSQTLLSSTSPFLANCTGGLCLPSTTSTPIWSDATKVNWGTATNTFAYGSTITATNLGLISSQPQYVVELLPEPPKGVGQSLATGKGNSISTVEIFRVTSRGLGGSANAPVMVQSVYKK
ncbi:MAG: pilus assembly protein PilX [Piscirickettsiaceae bacterium]|nr:MAG: pilus assembly protein PilX [Piscirickettsiaceae bacterium]PCI65799.1 MAG: pilus assembly protein PilX [Piscirickettsiaceae bacterium]